MISYTGTKVSRLLRLFTRNKYTHVSISFDEELNELYSFGRRNLYFPLIGGLIKEDLDDGVYKKYVETYCCIYEIETTEDKFYEAKQILNNFLSEQSEYKYNFIGLVAMALNFPLQRKYHFVCSQFVAFILNNTGIVKFNINVYLARPKDFESITGSRLIYSGVLKDYRRQLTIC
jgi:hypothetical protein